MSYISRNQILYSYGPGAVIDTEDGSFIVPTCELWGTNYGVALDDEPRIKKKIKVETIRTPAEGLNGKSAILPVFRFPQWHFCKNDRCRKMTKTEGYNKNLPKCKHCNFKLIPMSFVLVCPAGHVNDVDWIRWVHKNDHSCKDPVLEYKHSTVSGGISDISITCICGDKKNFSNNMGAPKCPGKHPWDCPGDYHKCNMVTTIMQKEGSNFYYPFTSSSIDIPPNALYNFKSQDNIKIINDDNYAAIIQAIDNECGNLETLNNPWLKQIYLIPLATSTGLSIKNVIKIIESLYTKNSTKTNGDTSDINDITRGEYKILMSGREFLEDHRDNFRKRVVSFSSLPLSPFSAIEKSAYDIITQKIDNLCIIEKLRMVTVYQGFTRIDAYNTETLYPTKDGGQEKVKLVPANPLSKKWLPGVENFGEGIFFSLNQSALKEWASKPNVLKRAEFIDDQPERILIHTLAHLLIRQVTYDSGYGASSISERIYCFEGENIPPGLLIYTIGDSEGALGGLSRQGKLERFIPLVYAAVANAQWCSNDPICIESRGQGLGSKNLAACHSCTLLPETSCSGFNCGLDRAMVVGIETGDSATRIPGFFEELLNIIEE